MLCKYECGQPIAFNILKKALESNKIAHAYLFHSSDSNVNMDVAISFAKSLFCPKTKIDNKNCDSCNICNRIDNNNFPELKIIQSDGLWIKKNQLTDLQEDFKHKALEGNTKIYIINGVDRLNVQAANSILKFLEEPESNIIVLLTAHDIHNVLPTIISRCQLISLKTAPKVMNCDIDNIANKTLIKIAQIHYNNIEDLKNFIYDEKNTIKIEAIVLFVKKYESLKLDILVDTKKMWHDYFNDKEDYSWAFDMLALFYKDVLNMKVGKPLEIYDYYNDVVEFVASLNDESNIINKLQKILLIKEKIKYNMNLNLLMDKLIFEMERGEYL